MKCFSLSLSVTCQLCWPGDVSNWTMMRRCGVEVCLGIGGGSEEGQRPKRPSSTVCLTCPHVLFGLGGSISSDSLWLCRPVTGAPVSSAAAAANSPLTVWRSSRSLERGWQEKVSCFQQRRLITSRWTPWPLQCAHSCRSLLGSGEARFLSLQIPLKASEGETVSQTSGGRCIYFLGYYWTF